ncbi:MAG: hypothetical protein AVDCRST_MAG52-1841 [uncultured Blastococcus sp.]|uniref:Uncharacterized protein n=1 Tax=uncultured Blastococcus sp. TaxID=217144 RepID=A0A6J4I966_9ACTN|nr:MAG: hypothetical protein AVDCRST_MAG52-1841 [uncultured Blastococcus sp.]
MRVVATMRAGVIAGTGPRAPRRRRDAVLGRSVPLGARLHCTSAPVTGRCPRREDAVTLLAVG